MKRIRVPEGMLSAGRAVYSGYVTAEEGARRILEAALLWLSEHPQVPTDEQARALVKEFHVNDHLYQFSKGVIAEWQRRCFVQEEPEIPAEIQDLLWPDPELEYSGHVEFHDKAVIEAYRRGLRKRGE